MTADVRQQLTAALDRMEKLASEVQESSRVSNPDHELHGKVKWPRPRVEHVVSEYRDGGRLLEFVTAWDPATVLRLTERDRQLLARHRPETSGSGKPGRWCVGCDSNYEFVAECPELLAAAAFWLGTPEVDR